MNKLIGFDFEQYTTAYIKFINTDTKEEVEDKNLYERLLDQINSDTDIESGAYYCLDGTEYQMITEHYKTSTDYIGWESY